MKLENEIVAVCKENNIVLLGPNCLGLINNTLPVNASFAKAIPKPGNISFLSQSGAIISSVIDWSNENGIGFSKIFSMGNKAMLSETEILEYLYNDSETEVIVAYLENLKVTSKLTEILIQNSTKKPTIVLFGGKTSFGAKAAASHTGSIVSSYTAVKTYLHQAGIIIAEGLEDFTSFIQIFSRYQKINGERIAVITNAGGPSITTCDFLSKSNLKLAELTESTINHLNGKLRPETAKKNPVDLLGDATPVDYEIAISACLLDKFVDGIIVLLTPQSSTDVKEIAEVISNFKTDKPILNVFIGGDFVRQGIEIIKSSNNLCFEYPETAVNSIKALYDFSKTKNELLKSENRDGFYSEKAKFELMKKYDLPVLEYTEVDSLGNAFVAAGLIGYPVVVKTAKKEIVHKSDADGIRLNIKNEGELKKSVEDIGYPAIIGKMINKEQELFLGIKKDSTVGTVVAFGTGGIYSELYQDFSYRVAPLSKETALSMIEETKMGKILNGARSQKVFDLDRLAKIIVDTARFANDFQNIKEIDFNPIVASGSNYYIVDARIIPEEK